MVLPSGGALLQALAAMPMLPPGRFSTITGCWVRSLKALPMARARMSKAEPADSGTMIRRGCAGVSSAAIDAPPSATSASARLTRATTAFMQDAPHRTARRCGATPGGNVFKPFVVRLLRKRIRSKLEVHGHRLHALATFDQPRRPVAAAGPQPATFPAGIGIVDAAVKALGIEAERIRHAQRDHLAVLEGNQAVHEVGGGHRHVLAEAERVVLVYPAVVARLGAVFADAVEARSRILVERPALRAMIAGRLRSVERPLAFAPVETADVAACERHPHHALAVDIAAARAEAGHRNVVDFRECGFGRVGAGREPYDRARAGAQRPPDRTVGRARHDSVEHLRDALVLGRIQRLVGLDIFVSLAVAVGVEDERRPAL